MARIKIARGSKANLPADLMYGELFWEKEQTEVSDGVLLMGHPDGAAKDPLPIAGARAMKSLYFEGLWDASTGVYPTEAQVGSFYVVSVDGTGPAATFKYGDWAICIAVNGDGSTQWIKAINQAITTEDPLGLTRNPLDLTAGVIKLKYASDTLEINSEGKLAVKTYESFTLASGVTIDSFKAVALNSSGQAIIADKTTEETALVVGFAIQSADGSVDVQKFGRMTNPAWNFTDVGGPVYLGFTGGLLQDVATFATGDIAIQVGVAISATTLEIGIGTPYKIELGTDIYYIPLTQSISAGDVAHAPSSAAVYEFMFGQGVSPSFAGLNVSGDILPDADILRSIGSETLRFAHLYADEVHVGAHSLYVNGKKTIEDASNIMTFSTDEDQAIMMKTTASVPGSGAGSLSFQSANQFNVTAIGGASFTVPSNVNLKNIVFNNQSSGGNIQFQAANELSLIAPATRITGPLQITGDATIGGALTMTGSDTNFAVNNTILKLNQSQTGTPADTLVAGLEVSRGNPPNYRFAYVEHDQNFQVGMVGQMQPVATREAAPLSTGVPFWDATNFRFSTDTGFTYNAGTDTLVASKFSGALLGNADSATKLLNSRMIGGVAFDGTANINLPGVNAPGNQDTSGNAATSTLAAAATKLATARAIGGVNFDGTANINLPGVNTAGNQDTTGNAATATKLATARAIALSGDATGTVNFDGTAGVSITTNVAKINGIAPASVNTANAVVLRDGNGDFSARVISAQDLILTGQLTVGTMTTVNSTTVNIADNIIQVNGSLTGAPPANLQGGIQVNRGSSAAYQFLYDETTSSFRIGQAGSLQAVATRQDAPTANAIPYWNDSAKRLDSSGVTVSGSTLTGTLAGNASTATKLAAAKTIGGVSFDGSANINLPGVNIAGTQDTSGNAATATLAASATKLATARTIGGVSFDGTANINLPGVNTAGNQNTSGNAATITQITDNATASALNVVFAASAGTTASRTSSKLTFVPSTGNLTATVFTGAGTGLTGTAASLTAGNASKWSTARTITLGGDLTGSVSLDGSANVTLTAAVTNDSHSHTNSTLPAQASGATAAGFVAYNGTTAASGKFDGGTAAPSSADTTKLNYTGIFTASKVYNAVWNDIVDFLEVDESTPISFGKVYIADEDGRYKPSTKYLDEGIVGLVSDTYGFGVGHNPDKKQLPIAIGGFVLAEVDQIYKPGTPLTSSADGRLTEIKIEDKRDYPERIVATFLKAEKAEEWNGINVRGRHWVRVR